MDCVFCGAHCKTFIFGAATVTGILYHDLCSPCWQRLHHEQPTNTQYTDQAYLAVFERVQAQRIKLNLEYIAALQ